MNDFALLVYGVLQRISRYDARPENIPHKGVEWHPVVRETGPAFQGLVGDNWVIRAPDPSTIPPSPDQITASVQNHIEQTAQARGYDSALALVSYVPSTVTSWRAEAETFVPWRDQVWTTTYTKLAQIESGQIPPPASVDEFITWLPQITWPINGV